MNKSKLKLVPFIIILLCIGAYFYVSQLEIGDIHIYTGNVEGEEVQISTEISGELVELDFKEGDKINKGDKLFSIDVSDFDTKVKQLEIQKEIAQLKYEQLLDGATKDDINLSTSKLKSVEKRLNGAEIKYEHLKKNYDDIKVLYESKSVSKAELDNAKVKMDEAQSSMNSIKAEVDASRANLDKVLSGSDEENIKIAKAQVELKGLEIKSLNDQIKKGSKKSPISGIIQTLNYSVGENVNPGSPVLSIINMEELKLDIYIEQKDLHKYKVGYIVMIVDDYLKDKKVVGKISSISSKAEFTPKNVESKESKQEMMFKTRITITKGQEYLRPGMFVDVDILTPNK